MSNKTNLPSGSGICLDAQCLSVVGDDVIENLHIADGYVRGDRANGDSVASSTTVALEEDVGTFVNGETVVLVDNNAVLNDHIACRNFVQQVLGQPFERLGWVYALTIEAVGIVTSGEPITHAVGNQSGGCSLS